MLKAWWWRWHQRWSVFNQSSRTPSYINSPLQCPRCTLHKTVRSALSLVSFSSTASNNVDVLPKFRNEILLLYWCTSVRQINSLQIRTLYLNCFNLSHVYCYVLSIRHEVRRFSFTTLIYHNEHAHVFSKQHSLLWSSESTTAARRCRVIMPKIIGCLCCCVSPYAGAADLPFQNTQRHIRAQSNNHSLFRSPRWFQE